MPLDRAAPPTHPSATAHCAQRWPRVRLQKFRRTNPGRYKAASATCMDRRSRAEWWWPHRFKSCCFYTVAVLLAVR